MGVKRSDLNEKTLAAIDDKPAPDTWQMTLPYPPTINHYYVRTKHGMAIGKRGKEYRHTVVSMASRCGARPMSGRLIVEIAVFWPDKRKRDLDNLLKCLLDSLTHAKVYEDDKMIKDLRIYEEGYKKDGEVIVAVQVMP